MTCNRQKSHSCILKDQHASCLGSFGPYVDGWTYNYKRHHGKLSSTFSTVLNSSRESNLYPLGSMLPTIKAESLERLYKGAEKLAIFGSKARDDINTSCVRILFHPAFKIGGLRCWRIYIKSRCLGRRVPLSSLEAITPS